MSKIYKKMEKFCLNVTLYVKPERREEFIACILANQEGTLTTEPLCLLYTWGEDTKNPNTFHFQEAYIGEEGLEAHRKAAHFLKWEEFASSDPFTKPPVLMFFKSVGNDSKR